MREWYRIQLRLKGRSAWVWDEKLHCPHADCLANLDQLRRTAGGEFEFRIVPYQGDTLPC